MKTMLFFSVLFTVLFLFPFEQISAQEEDLYEGGTVWSLTFVRTGANKSDTYLKGLANTWVASMEEAKSEGLIVSYRILQGTAASKDDFNLILMIENESLGVFDPNKEKVQELKDHYQRGGLGDVVVKRYLNEVLQAMLEPIRKRREEFAKDSSMVMEILKNGTEKARITASETLSDVRSAMGINYFESKAINSLF